MKLIYLLIFNLFFCYSGNLVFAQSHGNLLKADNLTTNGNSTYSQYRDYTETLSFQFSAEHPVSRIAGQFKGDTPSFKEITFTQLSNVASNPFMSRLMTARSIDNMEFISLRTDSNGTPLVSYKVELKDVMITSGTTTLDIEGAPVDSFTVTYRAIKITTYKQSSSGVYTANAPFIFDQDSGTANF